MMIEFQISYYLFSVLEILYLVFMIVVIFRTSQMFLVLLLSKNF